MRHNAAMTAYFEKHPKRFPHLISKELAMACVIKWKGTAEEHALGIAEFDYAAWGLEGGAA